MKRIWNMPLKYREWKGMRLAVDLDNVHCPHCKEHLSLNLNRNRVAALAVLPCSLSILLPRVLNIDFLDNNYFKIGCIVLTVLLIIFSLTIQAYEKKKT